VIFKKYLDEDNDMDGNKNDGNEIIKTMNTSWNDFGNAYKLFPDNLFSDKYILEIDEKIKRIVDELNNIKMNDEDNEDAEMNDEDNAENKHANLLEQIHIDLFMYLYVNNMNIEDIFLDNVIMPAITKIYNIKDIYDIDNE
jgi:glutathionyl-hydroquinone reductase